MFDSTFHPARDRKPRRAFSLPVALGVHAAVFAALVGATLRTNDELPDPDEPIVLRVRPEPRAAAEAERGSRASGGTRGPVAARREVPAVAPLELPSSTPSLRDVVSDTQTVWEDLPGLPDGADSDEPGTGGGPGRGRGPGIDGDGDNGDGLPPRVGGNIRPPVLTLRVEPIYPESARRARIEGLVALDAVISADGEIEDVRIVKSAGPLLDSAAVDAVRRWKYRAATLNGRPVRVLLTVTVSFRLH